MNISVFGLGKLGAPLAIIILLIFVLTGCGPKIGIEETFYGFDGRVVVEFHEKQETAGMNFETEFMVFHFQDVGKYEVSFHVLKQFRSSSFWDCPEDFALTVHSGSRTILKKFEDGAMAPSFEMTISRNGEEETYNYRG